MKKFLICLVSIIVIICVGATTFYFIRDNEAISVQTKEVFCNAGDNFTVESLGITINHPNRKTKFNYEASEDDVKNNIVYDEATGSYNVSVDAEGEYTLKISTTNKRYSNLQVNIHVGSGSIAYPYYIFEESQLNKIGAVYGLNSYYKLMNDVKLSSSFAPIGAVEGYGFGGNFNGQGYTISGLTLKDNSYSNAGLFASINANGYVGNLTITNAKIEGEYSNCGILAGVVKGTVEKIGVKDSSIIVRSNLANVGGFVGKTQNAVLKSCFVDNVSITVDNANSKTFNSANTYNVFVGGFVGETDESTLNAVYANNVKIGSVNQNCLAGGLAGKMIIGTKTGVIEQSYANTTSTYANFGAFIGEIAYANNFNFESEDINVLRNLVGNVAILNNVTIADTNIVKIYNQNVNNFTSLDTSYFSNVKNPKNSVFFDKSNQIYLISAYSSVNEALANNKQSFVYYAVDAITTTYWDMDYVWHYHNVEMPTLRMNDITVAEPVSEYYLKDLEEIQIYDEATFVEAFSGDCFNKKFKILKDIDLSNTTLTPVALTKCTVNGNGKTITYSLSKTVNDCLSLFTKVTDSTIKDLNLNVKSIKGSAKYVAPLAGIVKTEEITSSISNVNASYAGNIALTNSNAFGGLVCLAEKSIIENCSVESLELNTSVKVVGGLVADSSSTIKGCDVKSTLRAKEVVGGVVATNSGEILGCSVETKIENFADNKYSYNIGGVVANNSGVVENTTATVNIIVKNTVENMNVGSVAAENTGKIISTKVEGEGISVIGGNNVAYIGGIVANNQGEIKTTNVLTKQIGSSISNGALRVGGVASINSGKVEEVIMSSNLFGNYVGGVAVEVKSSNADVNKVLVGKIANKQVQKLTLKADKYLANVVVDMRSGSVNNVQVVTKLEGEKSSTRSSLVALVFTYGSKINGVTVDSDFVGNGTRYAEVWSDFATCSDAKTFNVENCQDNGMFSIYRNNNQHGCMQNVVINNANSGVNDSIHSVGENFLFIPDSANNDDASFVKFTNAFNKASEFSGEYEFVYAKTSLFKINCKRTKTLKFAGDVWNSNNGINLAFVENYLNK